MSKRDRKEKPAHQSGYSIEKAYRKEADPHQKRLDKLRKEYEEALAATEKALEKAQKSYQKRLDAHERRFASEFESREASFDSDIASIKSTMHEHVEAFKENLLSLQRDHAEKRDAVQKEIDDLENQKQKKTKDIEDAHKKTIETYEKTLELSRENHSKNVKKTKEALQNALEKLNEHHRQQKKALENLKDDLDEKFNDIQGTLDSMDAETKQAIKQEDNALQYTLNTYRKHINQRIKEFSSVLQSHRVAFHEPFSEIETILNTLKTAYDAYKASFINDVNQDMKFEQARLKDLLKTPDLQDDDKALSEINRQLELQHMRKDTLIDHVTKIGEGVAKTSETLRAMGKAAREHLDETFQTYESSVAESQTMLKRKFDIFQNTSQAIATELIEEKDGEDDLRPFLKEARKVFEEALKSYLDYSTQKSEAVRETFAALMPLFEESDELRFYLDTEDAQKKIRINHEKISVEQQDASLNIEREQSQKHHTQETLDIDYHYDAKKAFHTSQADWLALEHKKALIEAKKNAQKDDVEVEREIERATLEHDLEESKSAIEKEHLEKAETLQIAIEKQKHALRLIDAKKKRDLALRELKSENERKERTVSLELEQNAQNLNRVKKSLNEKEKDIESAYQKKIRDLEKDFKEKEEKTVQSLRKLDKEHTDKLTFIERALKRETEKAESALKETRQTKQTRMDAIDDAIRQASDPLETHQAALEKDDPALKSILRVLGTPLLETFKHALRQSTETVEETQDLVMEQYESLLRKRDFPNKKIKQRLSKFRSAFKKTKDTLDDKRKQTEKEIERSATETLKSIRGADKIYLSGLKHRLNPLNEAMQSALQTMRKGAFDALDEAFNSLHEDDNALIKKAEDSARKAKSEEQERYIKAKAPLDESLEAINKERKEAIANLDSEKERELKDLRDSFEDEIAPLRDAYNKDQEKMNTLDREYEEKEDAIERELEKDKDRLEETLENRLETINATHENKRERVDSRLEDAKNIRSYHVQNEEAGKEDNEQSRKKHEAALQEHYETAKVGVEQWLRRTGEERKAAKDARKKALEAALEKYEERMLSSTSDLDQRIDKATREINDKTRMTKSRKGNLDATIEAYETQLEKTLRDISGTLKTSFESILKEAFTESIEPQRDPKDLFSQQDAIIESFIEDIAKDIENSSN